MRARQLPNAVRVSTTLFAISLLLAGCDRAQWREGDGVPRTAPDTIPDWVWADSNMIPVGDSMSAPIARNVLMVVFDPRATTAQRRAAIASVGGRLIGGEGPSVTGSEGTYYIRVDAPTRGQLHQVAERLESEPMVYVAMVAREFREVPQSP